MKNKKEERAYQQAELDEELAPGFWTKDRVAQLVALLFVVALVLIIIWQRGNIMEFSRGLASYGWLKYLGAFVIAAAASATVVIPVPGLAMTSVFGTLATTPWDPLWFGLASGLGATVGEMTGYVLGYSGRMAIPYTRTYERIVTWMQRWGSWTIFLLALIPNPLFDIAGIAAGILRYPVWKFVLVGAAGRLPKHILFSYLGYFGIHILPSGRPPKA
jgi:membrane protein DedA with SNARE-associated domain